ncbi:MAG: glycoside hydrolase family 2 TIM barrel-domain containing protein [Thermoguttaceae bacterium]
MKHANLAPQFGLALASLVIAAARVAAAEVPVAVKIVKHDNGYTLTRNGQPYYIKGVCGGSKLDQFVEAGGNSIRAYGAESLDNAQAKGLTVLVGLNTGKPRNGFNYSDPERLAAQKESIRRTVQRLKVHPAVLMWALGNESELNASEADRIRIWKAFNELAEMIKQIDPKHPVITVLAGLGRTKLSELNEHCPALDAVGLNSYGGMMSLPEEVKRQGWTRPYVVTEFGPRGHWEVGKTPWGIPIEDDSTTKAELYQRAYQHAVAGQGACLGSYVFLWGQKQEKTHTWYGMFLPDGSPLGAVDAMTYNWTGNWPANRCPRIGAGKVSVVAEGPTDTRQHTFAPGTKLKCAVDAADPDGDPITVRWDLRIDIADNPRTGGDREEPTPPIAGAVLSAGGNESVVQLPAKPGKYRIFAYVYDPKGRAATANVPILAK